jgi:phospholipid N-methyltransferase
MQIMASAAGRKAPVIEYGHGKGLLTTPLLEMRAQTRSMRHIRPSAASEGRFPP